MKVSLIIGVALLVPACGYAQGPKACEELKSEIGQKLDAKGVKSYSLDVVEKDKDADGKVVGTCDGGSKKIVYRKGATPADKDAAKPQ